MATRVTPEIVGEALDFVVQDWRERQIDALNQVQYPKVDSPDRFKAFAWLNFGITATTTLFPKSGLGKLLTKATGHFAVPLWIIGQVQGQFQKVYDEAVADSNKLLTAKFDDLRDSFTRKTQDEARRFRATEHGRKYIEQIFQYLKDTDYSDNHYVSVLCREIIHQANLIVTDPAKIRDLTQNGFGALLQKIALIWKGSYHSDSGKGIVFGYSQTGGTENAKWTYVKKREAHEQQDRVILAHAAEFQVWEDANGYTRVFRRMGGLDGLGGQPETYITQPIDMMSVVPLAMQALPPSSGGPVATKQREH